jgi:hypothetical protein
VVIDEIGPMEIRSPIFREAVNDALESKLPVLATIFARRLTFTEAIKSRPDVTLIEGSPGQSRASWLRTRQTDSSAGSRLMKQFPAGLQQVV